MNRYYQIALHVLIAQCAFFAVTRVVADEPRWGTLLARFVYDGTPPERAKVKFDKNREFYGKFDLRDESLMVGKDRGLANVLIHLDAPVGAKIPTHPDYRKSADAKVTLDNRNGLFVPHLFRAFHEKLGGIKTVEKDGVNIDWPKGKFEFEVRPGVNDLGKITLSPKLFEKEVR